MATIDEGKPFQDFLDNIKQIITDDLDGDNTLSLPGTRSIFMYDSPGVTVPCVKIIPADGGEVEFISTSGTIVRYHPAAVIEYHNYELNVNLGYQQVSNMLEKLIKLILNAKGSSSKRLSVNGWGLGAQITRTIMVREDSGARPVQIAGVLLEAISDNQTIT